MGREKSERKASVVEQPAYPIGYGEAAAVYAEPEDHGDGAARVRNLEERFVPRALPLFKRQSREVGELLPELYSHGLAGGIWRLR